MCVEDLEVMLLISTFCRIGLSLTRLCLVTEASVVILMYLNNNRIEI